MNTAADFTTAIANPWRPDAVPKRFQLQLIGTESEDRLDKKICPWDAIKMYEFDDGMEVSEYFYDITKLKKIDGGYVIDDAEKQHLEEEAKQLLRITETYGRKNRTHRDGSTRCAPVVDCDPHAHGRMLPIAAKLDRNGLLVLGNLGWGDPRAPLRYLKGEILERLRSSSRGDAQLSVPDAPARPERGRLPQLSGRML